MERCKTFWRVALLVGLLLGVGAPETPAQTAPPALEGLFQRVPPEGRTLVEGKIREAVRVGVPIGEAASILERGLHRRLSPAAIGNLLDLAKEGGRERLPLRPLLNKIKEGLAKGVPPSRIEAVSRTILDDLKTSREMVRNAEKLGLRPTSQGEQHRTIEALAEAKWRGIPLKTLRNLSKEFRERRNGERSSISRVGGAAQTLVTLMDLGLSAPSATETVRLGISRGLSAEEFQRLERVIRRGRRGRSSAEDVAERVRESLAAGREIREIERELRERRGRDDGDQSGEERREQEDREQLREERRGRDRGEERFEEKQIERHERRDRDRPDRRERRERHDRSGRGGRD